MTCVERRSPTQNASQPDPASVQQKKHQQWHPYVRKLHRPSTLRWQLKVMVGDTTQYMGGHTCWKFQGLSNHA